MEIFKTYDKSFYDYLLNNGTSFGMSVKMYAEYLLDTAKKGEIKMNYDKTYYELN
jgi:hypothetical protein